MELRRYLRVLGRRRGVGAAAFLVTSVATVILVTLQAPVYEARGTALLHPRERDTDTAIDASDLLVRGVKIAETYASVARSDMIRERAEARLGPGFDVSGITIASEVVTDTNIMSISARGADPEAVQALSAAVMSETIAYAATLDDPYQISPLDQPREAAPAGPNKGVTIALGVLFGFVLALVLALFAEYLDGGMDPESAVLDMPTGLHNEEYLRQRLREEMSLVDRTGRTFALAAFRVAMRRADEGSEHWGPPTDPDLERIGEFLPLAVRDEVVIAHLGDGEFTAILPEMDRPMADRTLARWESGVSAVLEGHQQGAHVTPGFSEGVCLYFDGAFDGDREAVRAARRLTDREASTVVRARPGPVPAQPALPARTRIESRGAVRPDPDEPRRLRSDPDEPRRMRSDPDEPRRLRPDPDEPRRLRPDPEEPRRGRSDPDQPKRARSDPDGNGHDARRGATVELHVAPDPATEATAGAGRPKPRRSGHRSSKGSKGKPRAANRRR